MPSFNRARSKTPGAVPGEGTGVEAFMPLQPKNNLERIKLVKATRTDPRAYGQDRAAGVVTGASEPRLAARPVQNNHTNPVRAQHRKPTKGKLTDPRLNRAARPPATLGTQKSAPCHNVNNNQRPTTPANNQSLMHERSRSRSQNLRDRSRSHSRNRRAFIDEDDGEDERDEDNNYESPSPAGRIFAPSPSTLPKSYLSFLEEEDDEEENADDQPNATPPNVHLPPQRKRVHERPVSRAAAENSRNGKRVSIDQPDNNFDSTTPKRARTNSGAGGQTTMSQKRPRSAQQIAARPRATSISSNSSQDSAMNARQPSPLPMDNSHQQQADTESTSPLSRRSMANSSATDWFQHQLQFAEYLEGQDELFQARCNLVADTQAELSLFLKHVNTEIKKGNNNNSRR